MDWSNERYVRIYTRDTLTWKRIKWEGQCVLMQLTRKLDRAGVLDIGSVDPYEAVEAITDLPSEIVKIGLDRCIENGVFVLDVERLLMPNFLSAQETAATDAERQRRHRAKIRAALSQDVTEGHNLYFIQAGGSDGPIKIGRTDGHPKIRLDQLQIGSYEKLVLLGYNEKGDEEEQVHERFEHLRIRGEWFRCAPELIEYISDHSKSQLVTNCHSVPSVPSVPPVPPKPTVLPDRARARSEERPPKIGPEEPEPKIKSEPKGKSKDYMAEAAKRDELKAICCAEHFEVTGHELELDLSIPSLDRRALAALSWAERERPADWRAAVRESYRAYLTAGSDKEKAAGYPWEWWAREPSKYLVKGMNGKSNDPLSVEFRALQQELADSNPGEARREWIVKRQREISNEVQQKKHPEWFMAKERPQ